MTRFAWLQSRTQTLVVAGLLAVLAVVAAVTGIELSHLFHRDVAHCTTGCGLAIDRFLSHDSFMERTLDVLARAVPALLGIFWGAPLLAREFDTGTFRVAWTQSVSRRRWLLTKLGLGGLTTVAVAGVLTLTVTWWYSSRDQVGGADPYAVFDRRDIAPIAYAAFAFASGALIGAIARRTLSAMAATLGVFVLARVAVAVWVRPHLLTPLHRTLSLLGAGPGSPATSVGLASRNGGPLQLIAEGHGPPRSWTLSSQLVTNSGHPAGAGQITAFLQQHCHVALSMPPPVGDGIARAPAGDPGSACLAQVARSFHLVVSYQPADRYWTFQWLETGIFAALALAAAGGCYWWVTRRAN